MTDNKFSFKEVYDVFLRTHHATKIGNVHYPAGSIVAIFDRIDVLQFETSNQTRIAQGGFNNSYLVAWNWQEGGSLAFSEGIFSEHHLALMTNSKMITTEDVDLVITKQEELISSEENVITLKHEPHQILTITNLRTNTLVADVKELGNQSYEVDEPLVSYYVIYEFMYKDLMKTVRVGDQLIEGFLSFEAKTRVKEEGTGRERVGVIKIPKLQLLSGLSMRLGRSADPMSAPFKAIVTPVEREGKKVSVELFFLEDEI